MLIKKKRLKTNKNVQKAKVKQAVRVSSKKVARASLAKIAHNKKHLKTNKKMQNAKLKKNIKYKS